MMPIQPGELAWNNATIADFRGHGGRITTGPLAGAAILLMRTTGARTGEVRTAPLGYTRDGERYVVVGSNSGLPHQPGWLYNIRTEPLVTIEVGSETFKARATVIEGSERRRLWNAHVAAIPAFGDYERMTDRELQVVTVERLAESLSEGRQRLDPEGVEE